MSELTINERIKFLIEKSGMSVRAFSNAIGATDTNTRNYIDRGSKPNSDFLEKLLRRFNDTNPTWLLLGEGDPFLLKKPNSIELHTNSTQNTSPTKNNSGNAIGINHGFSTQQQGGLPGNEAALLKEIEFLKAQLAMKDIVIAAKDETIDLLKAAFNRPN